jgi:hypothetical protein
MGAGRCREIVKSRLKISYHLYIQVPFEEKDYQADGSRREVANLTATQSAT